MWEREKKDLEEILRTMNEFTKALNYLEDEWGGLYTSEWDDGGELSVRLDILSEDLGRLKIGIQNQIKLDDKHYNGETDEEES